MSWFRCGRSVPPPLLQTWRLDFQKKQPLQGWGFPPALCFALAALILLPFCSICSPLLSFALSARPRSRSLRPGPPARPTPERGDAAPAAAPRPRAGAGSVLPPFPANLFIFPKKKAAACLSQNDVTLRGGEGNL